MGGQHEPNIFTCTFCFSVSTDQPHVLGRSARLTCTDCYLTIINLSICWVCGELIFRETECVSFGWCFWHRACYGCLLYGSRNLCVSVLGVPSDSEEDVEHGRKQEIMEPPLCALCTTECEVDGIESDDILQKGLKRIDMVDGGVTRRRWAEKTRSRLEPFRVERVATDPTPSSERLVHHSEVDYGGKIVWVNINDPINGSSFRPHPLKPIPLQMQAPSSKSTIEYLHPSTKQPKAEPGDVSGSLAQARATQRAAPTRLQHLMSPLPRKPDFEEVSDARGNMTSRIRGFVTGEDPLSMTLPSERIGRLDRHSEPCRTYCTTEEAPTKDDRERKSRSIF